ncbi:transposase [Spirillospora sp. NPDC047418]
MAAMAAMAAVRTLVCQRLDDGDAAAILDESGQEKKVGTRTVGVKRQYVRCAGRVSNAINVVYCNFATAAGHALVALARPESGASAIRKAAVGGRVAARIERDGPVTTVIMSRSEARNAPRASHRPRPGRTRPGTPDRWCPRPSLNWAARSAVEGLSWLICTPNNGFRRG